MTLQGAAAANQKAGRQQSAAAPPPTQPSEDTMAQKESVVTAETGSKRARHRNRNKAGQDGAPPPQPLSPLSSAPPQPFASSPMPQSDVVLADTPKPAGNLQRARNPEAAAEWQRGGAHAATAASASLPAHRMSTEEIEYARAQARAVLNELAAQHAAKTRDSMTRNQPFFHPVKAAPSVAVKSGPEAHHPTVMQVAAQEPDQGWSEKDQGDVSAWQQVSLKSSGKVYWYNVHTGATQWHPPVAAASAPSQGPAAAPSKSIPIAAATPGSGTRSKPAQPAQPAYRVQRSTEQIFYECRKQALQESGFLRQEVLERMVQQTVGHREYQRDSGMRDLCNATRKTLATVNTMIEAVIATHNIITLHDLERHIILRLRDFADISSFDQLGLGALILHEKVRLFFRPSARLLERACTPAVTTADVLEGVGEQMRRGALLALDRQQAPSRDEQAQMMEEVLNSIARRFCAGEDALSQSSGCVRPRAQTELNDSARDGGDEGVPTWRDLGIFFKAPSLIVFLLSFARRHAHHERQQMEALLQRSKALETSRAALSSVQEAAEWLEEQRAFVTALCKKSDALVEGHRQQRERHDQLAAERAARSIDAAGQKAYLTLGLQAELQDLSAAESSGASHHAAALAATAPSVDGGNNSKVWDGEAGDAAMAVTQIAARLTDYVRRQHGRQAGGSGGPAGRGSVDGGATVEAGLPGGLNEKQHEDVRRWESSLAKLVAPVLVCALLKLPLRGEGHVLVAYQHTRKELHSALAAVLSTSALTAGVDSATLLLRAEMKFLETLGATSPHQAPTSLVRELAASQELRDLLDRTLAATALARSHGEQGLGGVEEATLRSYSKSENEGSGVHEAGALLENICVFLRECERQRSRGGSASGIRQGSSRLENLQGRAWGEGGMTDGGACRDGLSEGEEEDGIENSSGPGGLQKMLTNLADAEERICELHKVYSFESLGGMSLLKFLSQPQHLSEVESLLPSLAATSHGEGSSAHSASCPRLVQLLLLMAENAGKVLVSTHCTITMPAGRSNQFGAGLREHVLRELETALLDNTKMRRWRRMLEAHMGARLEEFGYTGMRDLVNAAKRYAGGSYRSSAGSIRSFLPSLCFVHATGTCLNSSDTVVMQALAEIESAPFLVDLRRYLDWDLRWCPALGPLCAFVCDHGSRSTVVDRGGEGGCGDGGGGRCLPGRIVEVVYGSLIKVPSASHSLRLEFNIAVPNDPLAAAAAAVGMTMGEDGLAVMGGEHSIQHGGGAAERGVDALQLMAEYVKSKLGHLMVWEAASFAFRALKFTPQPLRQTLALPLFIKPYLHAKYRGCSIGVESGACGGAGLDTKEEVLFMFCASLDDVSMLCQMGKALGRNLWDQVLTSTSSAACDPLTLCRLLTGTSLFANMESAAKGTGSGSVGDMSGLQTFRNDGSAERLGGGVQGHCAGIREAYEGRYAISEDIISREREGSTQKEDRLLDIDTAISRSGAELEDGEEIHPETLSVCESVRAKFGLNVPDLSKEAREAICNMHRLTNRSIKRLAEDLYSQEVHFVLELVQNCDDCSFAPDVEPSLVVHLSATRLEFRSNELGFETKNVLALCDIGKSTKEMQAGYIGQKGIGFKSVFKITRCPQIHSRNFHFCFKAPRSFSNTHGTHDSLGYIIPFPLPIPEPWDARSGTFIVLPLERASENHPSDLQDLRQNLSDIQASLLLFLNKLARIEVHDMSRSTHGVGSGENFSGESQERESSQAVYIRRMSKRALSDGVVEVMDSYSTAASGKDPKGKGAPEKVLKTSQARWLVVDEILAAEAHVPRPGVERTKLSIAIPLISARDLVRGHEAPPPRDVYAFLPLRSYGFRFIVQGDFVVPSSREAVDASSPWNHWLREKLAPLFVTTMLRMVVLSLDRARECSLARSLAGRCGMQSKHAMVAGKPALGSENSSPVLVPIFSELEAHVVERHEQEAETLIDVEVDTGKVGEEDECYLLNVAFAMIPLPGQISDFFAPVPAQVLSLLRHQEILPTLAPHEHVSNGEGEQDMEEHSPLTSSLQFTYPEMAVRRPVHSRPHLDMCTEVFLRRLGYSFVHPHVIFPPGVEEALGCLSLDPELWCAILTESASVWASKMALDPGMPPEGSADKYQFDGDWLIYVLAQLSKSRGYSRVVPQLKKIAIFPTLSGKLVRLEDGPVLQLIDDTQHAFLCEASFLARTLHPEFRAALQRDLDANKMAMQLGVTRVDGESFLKRHLLPALCDERMDAASLISMLAFVKDKMAHMSRVSVTALLDEYRGKIWLVDQSGRPALSGPVLHIGRQYVATAPDPGLFLPQDLQCVRGNAAATAWWRTVSHDYLTLSNDPGGWAAIFASLGLKTFVYVLPTPPHDSPELARLLETVAAPAGSPHPSVSEGQLARLQHLALLLSQSWKDYAPIARKVSDGGDPRQESDSAGESNSVFFLTRLRETAWIPGSDGMLYRPRELLSDNSRPLLGNKGVYAALPKKLSREFVADIGLAPPLSGTSLLRLVELWASDPRTRVSVSFMRKLYCFLHRNASPADRAGMASRALLFVPTRSHVVTSECKKGGTEVVLNLDRETEGQWMRAKDCVMQDKSYLLDSVKSDVSVNMHELAARAGTRALQAYYCNSDAKEDDAEMSSFLQTVGVPLTLSDDKYVTILQCAQDMLQRSAARGGDGAKNVEAVACALRVFVHWSYEAEERDREGGDDPRQTQEQDAVCQLRAFLASRRIRIPCCRVPGNEEASEDRWGWRDCNEVFFIDDRVVCSSCTFGCRNTCECQFDQDLLQRCAKLPPFPGISSVRPSPDYHKRKDEDIVIKKMRERMWVFYTQVMGLPRLSQCLRPSVTVRPPPQDARLRLAGSIPAVVVALRALQWFSLSLLPSGKHRKGARDKMGVLSVAERREVEKLAKALEVFEAEHVCVSPVAERCQATSPNPPEGARPGPGGHESWSGLGQTRECVVDFSCFAEYGGDAGCEGGDKGFQHKEDSKDGGVSKASNATDGCSSKAVSMLPCRRKVFLATTDVAFRDRGALADALARLILHSDDASESTAVEERGRGGSEYSKEDRRFKLRGLAAREMMNALSKLTPGCIKMEEDEVSALVPRPPSAAVLLEGKTSGAEAGGDAEICQEGDCGGEVPWVLVSEDAFSSQLGKEAEKSDAHDVDNQANASVHAALFRQIGRGAAGEGGGGVVRECAASVPSGRGVFEESAPDGGGGLDPTLKAAVERQKKERELIKQRIKDERHRGTGAPSNMIPVSTGDDVQKARASNSGVFLGGGGRSGGWRLTGLALPQFAGEEGGEIRARGGNGNEDVVDGSVPSSPVVDGSGGAEEENNGKHGAEIAAAQGARDGEGQDGSAGAQAAGAKEGGGGGGEEDPDRGKRPHPTPLLEDPTLEASDAGVWFGHHEISRRVSSNVSSSVSGLVGASRAGRVLSEQELRAMGRWGEEVASKVLAERDDLCDVVWVNAHAETGHPYDITLRSKQDPQQLVFVEVKTSTLKMEQAQCTSPCPISLLELNFALEKGKNYWVCRVFGALTEHAKVVIFKDLASRLLRSQAQLLVDLPFESP